MELPSICSLASIISVMILVSCTSGSPEKEKASKPYSVEQMYDENQPQPPVVTTAAINAPVKAPSDAIVLFDGTDLSRWTGPNNGEPRWKLEKGYMEVIKDVGDIFTKQGFGSCQLHIEWASPSEVSGAGQDRGNSGVYFMGLYEIQVLDSYNNITYPAGMAGSVYGMNPPLVNASKPPGEWQSYDIVFRRPVFENGKLVKPAVITVFHNGILIQDHFEILGATVFRKEPQYSAHADKLPLMLQNHGNPVRFRNIRIRELPDQK